MIKINGDCFKAILIQIRQTEDQKLILVSLRLRVLDLLPCSAMLLDLIQVLNNPPVNLILLTRLGRPYKAVSEVFPSKVPL